MPLWNNKNIQADAPIWKGTVVKPKDYASNPPVTVTATFQTGNNIITGITSTAGIAVDQRVFSSNAIVNSAISHETLVAAVINTTAVQLSDTFKGANTVGASISFQDNFVTGYTAYENTTPGAFTSGITAGVFAVNSSNEFAFGHTASGWIEVKYGTGPVKTLSITGTTFVNGDVITVSGGQTNATATVTTNTTGGIASLNITNYGFGFTNATSLHISTNSANGVITGNTVTLGGRSGRIYTENLVAMNGKTFG